MKSLLSLIALAAALGGGVAQAQYTDGIIKIGVMNDMSGTYKDLGGQGSVIAARMAVKDFGAATRGVKVEIVGADHQNKPDVGSNIVRTWIDTDQVDVIVDVPTSSVALAVNEIVRDKNKVFLVSGAAASDLTGPECTPNTIHWTYDTWALAHGTGKAIVKTGGDTSSFLLQAQASKAKIIGLANAGADTINSITQASEFGITQGGQNLAALLAFITDVHALGLQTAQGLIMTEAWYWDLNDANREFAKKFAPQDKGVHPTMVHAGVYSAVTHYLKAVEALKSDADGKAVVAKMKEMPTDDKLFGKGTVRADGRKIHPMYLFEVKKPAESKAPWDYYKLRATIPADEAFRPLADGGCPLVKS